MDRLPEDALLVRPAGQEETWTRTHELLATLVEVMSVAASERRLKKPIEVPRPRPPKRRPVAEAQTRREVEKAAGAVSVTDAMSSMQAAGRVRSAQDPTTAPAPPAGVEPAGGTAGNAAGNAADSSTPVAAGSEQ